MGLPCNWQACLLMSKVVNSFKQGLLCTVVAQLVGGGGVVGLCLISHTVSGCIPKQQSKLSLQAGRPHTGPLFARDSIKGLKL